MCIGVHVRGYKEQSTLCAFVYTCIYLYTCMCTCICMLICMHIYMCIYVCVYIGECVCMYSICVCTYICMCALCIYVCMCIHMHVHMCVYLCVYIYALYIPLQKRFRKAQTPVPVDLAYLIASFCFIIST